MGADPLRHRSVRRRPVGRVVHLALDQLGPGEIFGWAHSLNKSVREAPWFYAAYLFMLLTAGAVTLVTSETV